MGGLVFITDDARALYEALQERGVTDFTQEPTEHFYGTDMGSGTRSERDPDPAAEAGRGPRVSLTEEREMPSNTSTKSGFTDDEKAAMQERARELKATRSKGGKVRR